jgi:hypothetical protein
MIRAALLSLAYRITRTNAQAASRAPISGRGMRDELCDVVSSRRTVGRPTSASVATRARSSRSGPSDTARASTCARRATLGLDATRVARACRVDCWMTGRPELCAVTVIPLPASTGSEAATSSAATASGGASTLVSAAPGEAAGSAGASDRAGACTAGAGAGAGTAGAGGRTLSGSTYPCGSLVVRTPK